MSGNVWTAGDRRGRENVSGSSSRPYPSAKGGNVQEVRDGLKKAFELATAAVPAESRNALYYKSAGGQSGNAKAGGQLATKPTTMANGKDFLQEIRKQISALQHLNERAGG